MVTVSSIILSNVYKEILLFPNLIRQDEVEKRSCVNILLSSSIRSYVNSDEIGIFITSTFLVMTNICI